MSRALSPGRMMLTVALVDRHLREAGLEHRARFVASGNDTTDDRIEIVEVEGGIPMSIQLARWWYRVKRYHVGDDGEVLAVKDLGSFATPGEAAARVVEVLRRGAAGDA